IPGVSERWPAWPKVRRVLAWVALRNMLYGGLTLAIGEFSSHTGARSKTRAWVTSRMNLRTFPDPFACSAAAGPAAPAARPAVARTTLRMKSRRATERASSGTFRLSWVMISLPTSHVLCDGAMLGEDGWKGNRLTGRVLSAGPRALVPRGRRRLEKSRYCP